MSSVATSNFNSNYQGGTILLREDNNAKNSPQMKPKRNRIKYKKIYSSKDIK